MTARPGESNADDLLADPEAGFAGGIEGLIFGILIFVVGTLLVANAWGAVDTKSAVSAAALQAARSYVEAPDGAAASTDAKAAADAALLGYGRNPNLARIALVSGSWGRCHRITIQVRYPAPVTDLPYVGRVGQGESVSAEHSEIVDPYRSGLAGTATC